MKKLAHQLHHLLVQKNRSTLEAERLQRKMSDKSPFPTIIRHLIGTNRNVLKLPKTTNAVISAQNVPVRSRNNQKDYLRVT